MADTLQKWADYIDDYEAKMVEVRQRTQAILDDPTKTADEKKAALDEQYRQEIHLKELKAQYDAYSISGVVPDTVTFGGASSTSPVLIYKSNVTGDTIHHGTISSSWAGSGDLSQPGDEVPIGSIFTSDLLLISVKVVRTQYTASQQTDVSFSGPRTVQLSSGYDWYIDSNKNLDYYTANRFNPTGLSITMYDDLWSNGNARPLIRGYWGSVSNAVNINENSSHSCPITFTLLSMLTNPEGEVPGESPWDYYNDILRPSVPGNPAFPDGYEPPFDPDDPDDTPTTDPDTLPHDDGDTPLPFQEGNQVDAPTMFITQYVCTKSDLTLLGANLWSSWVDPNAGANTAKNFIFDYFQDTGTFNITTALDYIISLRVFPFSFYNAHVTVSPSDGIYIGTGHSNFTNQLVDVLNEVNGWIDAGKVKVLPAEPYNDFRDMYNCTIQLYMPFCGSLELNPVEVINREVSVRYYIDFQSACCTAVAFVQGDKGKYPIGSKSGQIGFTLPITATNSGQLAAQFASDATRALGTVGNFGMQMAKAALAASTAQAGGELAAAKSPEYASQISQSTSLQLKGINQGVVGSTGNLGLDLANQAIDMLSRSGVGMPLLSGGGGCESLMFQAGCTIQIRRGKYVNLNDIQYGHMQGNALAETKPISEFSGFCKFAGVDTTGLTCHNDERNEILSLLESGVYV